MTQISRNTAFPTSLHVRPAKTQISLYIRTVLSELRGHYVGSQGSKASKDDRQRI